MESTDPSISRGTPDSLPWQKKLLVIPVFIPHEGCPHSCIFCNQHRISGISGPPVNGKDVAAIVQRWLSRGGKAGSRSVQVAFYGGSFTGLPFCRQEELLTAVTPFLASGKVQSLRLSTRPDYVNRGVVRFLRHHQVATVELGVQSLDDRVLDRSLRGHGAQDVFCATKLLKDADMELGLQLMVGLPGQSFASLRRTVNQVLALAPAFVRIYPVLVVRGSGLEQLYTKGAYTPLSLGRAVLQTAWMKKKCIAASIRVVRMGLQPGPELERSLVVGPYHPAFGELVESRLMLQQTRKLLCKTRSQESVILRISDRDQSVFRGMGSGNIQRLTALGLSDRFTLQTDSTQPRSTIRVLPVVHPQPLDSRS